MYKRIKNSLLSPKGIASYYNDKKWVTLMYVLILALLYAIPAIGTLKYVGTNITTIIEEQVVFNEEIEYIIENKKLVSTTDSNKNYVFDAGQFNQYNLFIAIGEKVDNSKIIKTNNNLVNVVLHYGIDGLYLSVPVNITKTTDENNISYKLIEYTEEKIDLRLVNDNDFYATNYLFKLIRNYINSQSGTIYGIGIPLLTISSLVDLLFTVLIMALIGYILNRKFGIKFGTTFKLALYSILPLIIGYMFSIFLNNFVGTILYYIGFFLSVTYFLRSIRYYLLNQFKTMKDEGENNNESI